MNVHMRVDMYRDGILYRPIRGNCLRKGIAYTQQIGVDILHYTLKSKIE